MTDLRLSKKLFNDVYFPYLYKYDNRVEVYYGGAGSGKSVFIGQKLIIKALSSKRKILVVRKTLASQRDSCWRLFIDLFTRWQIRSQVKIGLSTYSIVLPNGSEILFKGLDDREKIKSIVDITDIWIEEATELEEEDFDQLDLRLRSSQGNLQIFVSFNPVSKASWVYKRWFENSTDAFILKTTYKDNKFLPDSYVETLENMQDKNPAYYRIYALGDFCSLDRLIFDKYTVDSIDIKEHGGILCVGLDFGYINDPTAIVASFVNEETKSIYIFKEFRAEGKTNDEIAEILKSLGFSKSVIIADSAEQKSIEEIRRLGISRIKASVKGPDSVRHGIQKLQQYSIIVDPSCKELIEEFQNYSWKKDRKTGEYINEPIDAFNHFIDALRYSLQCIETNKLKSINKAKLLGL